MTSRRKSKFSQLLKDWLSDPTPRRLVALFESEEVIRPRAFNADSVPSVLVSALAQPPGTVQVVALTVVDVPVTMALLAIGRPDAERAWDVWNTVRGRMPEWIDLGSRAHRFDRPKLAPEIGGLRLLGADGEPVTIINIDLPRKSAVAIFNAIKPQVVIPALLAGGAAWLARNAQRHPVAMAGMAAAVAAGITGSAATVILDAEDRHDPPSRIVVVSPVPAVTRTVTATPTRPAATASPSTSRPEARTATPTPSSATSTWPPQPTPPGTGGGIHRQAPARPTPTWPPTSVPVDTPPPSTVPSAQPTPEGADAEKDKAKPSAKPGEDDQHGGRGGLQVVVTVPPVFGLNLRVG